MAVTGYSGLYNGVYNTPYAPITTLHGGDWEALTIKFGPRSYSRGILKKLIVALNGVAAGASASLTHYRVQAVANTSDNVQGGLRAIEAKSLINRVTTATDQTNIGAAIARSSKPSTYPVDPSGNGGGGKLGR